MLLFVIVLCACTLAASLRACAWDCACDSAGGCADVRVRGRAWLQPLDTTIELAYFHDTRNTHTHRFPGNDSRQGLDAKPGIADPRATRRIRAFTRASVVTTDSSFDTEPQAPRQLGAFASTSVEASSAPRRRLVFACSGVGGWGWAFFQIVCSSPRERDARNCPVLCCSWSITQ
jgi:hypothetical protein